MGMIGGSVLTILNGVGVAVIASLVLVMARARKKKESRGHSDAVGP